MPSHSEKRLMPYTPAQMYDLVGDVARYPEFLPWCSAARIRSRRRQGESEVVEADLVISFRVFREKFGSRVTLHDDGSLIGIDYLDGPFKYLNSQWRFGPAPGGCEVDFHVDFEFRSRILQGVIGLVFGEAMRRIVRAFETRAAQLYGAGSETGSGPDSGG